MKFLFCVILLFAGTINSSAMPLVFKITKQTAGEIAVIDTTKYQKVCILATAADKDALCAISVFGIEEKMGFILLRTPSF